MTNSDGYITSQTNLEGDIIAEATSLIFNNDKPISLMVQGITGPMEQMGSFSYYANTMPENLQKTVTEINNEVLKANKLETAALFSNNHLQNFTLGSSTYYNSVTTFNPVSGFEGYPQNQEIMIEGQPFAYIIYHFQN
jgi:hypothetical protein